jgi:hypothetical protein
LGLQADFESDFAQFFTDPDLMPGGEEITYTAKGEDAVTINANVVRRPIEGHAPNGLAVVLSVYIANDATYGVTSVTVGADQVTLQARLGDTAQPYRVSDIISHDAGMWHLRLDVNG